MTNIFNMNHKFQLVPIVLLFSLLTIGFISKVSAENGPSGIFSDMSLSTAKEKAVAENKMIFVDFYASWCVPCKWMDETTFADKDVRSYLENNFITLRIDIDDFDGFAIKEHYNIRVLPTILILDHRGVTLERKEESLSPAKMLEILKNRQPIGKIAKVNSSPIKKNKINGNLLSSKQSENQPLVEKEVSHATVETTYRVQVGVFTDYANTKKMIEEIKDFSNEPVVVMNEKLHQKNVFKVLVGDFDNRGSANIFKNQLWQNYGIDGYVK